ncbi:MAG: helix-turn-helix domain-containing protein [Clostridium sp.]|nr:helix-turn-helix domain-containing protein [Clostridium sp.]
MGKASKWLNKDGLEQIEKWARLGLSDRQIAKNMGIGRSTFYEWKKKYKDISDTLDKGKAIVNEEVENALLKKALGFKYKEQQAIKVKEIYYDEKGRKCQKEDVKIVEVEKEVLADTVAIKFWLVNRERERWSDNPNKVEIDKELLELKKKEIEKNTI